MTLAFQLSILPYCTYPVMAGMVTQDEDARRKADVTQRQSMKFVCCHMNTHSKLTDKRAMPLCCFTTSGSVSVRAASVVYTMVSHLLR